KEAVQTVKAAFPDMKVIVGGAPVTPVYAEEIGADGYAPDAGSSAAKAKELIGVK
ncbi:MAG: cobalamin-binding protein, partial [Firmicutes bacterium HGW-Firmicutes-15]